MPAPMRRFHCSVACPGGLLPAPMACCLLQCAVSIALLPAPVACCLPRCGPVFARIARGWLRRPDGGLSCEVRWLGPGRGQFCRQSRALEGKHPPVGLMYGLFCMLFVTTVRPSTRPSGWCSGCFACGVGLSKAYRHFASVIALTKCGGAGKAEPLCRAAPQPPTRIPVSL